MRRIHDKVTTRYILTIKRPSTTAVDRLTASNQVTTPDDDAVVTIVRSAEIQSTRYVEDDDTLSAANARLRLANPIAICCTPYTVALAEIVA